MNLKSRIREIPDFPKKGIRYYDITTLLKDPLAFREVLDQLSAPFLDKNIQKVVAIESRGFIFGAPLAERLNAGFVPVRKPGKLPAETIEESYDLEYGTDQLCIHQDAVYEGETVLLVDDLLATGGTMGAAINLVKKIGGDIVGIALVIELPGLNGREKLGEIPVFSLLRYE